MRKLAWFGVTDVLTIMLILCAVASAQVGEDNPLVPLVETQFWDLAVHGEPLGAHLGVAGDACACVHYQGIARGQDSEGVPHLYLGRSGNDSGFCAALCYSFRGDSKPGELVVVRMDSREKGGERLRSNLLKKEEDAGDDVKHNYACVDPVPLIGHMVCTLAPEDDRGIGHEPEEGIETSYYFDGTFLLSESFNESATYTGGSPMYMHPGGMQMVGNVLIVALEAPCVDYFEGAGSVEPGDCNETGSGQGAIVLIDVRNPDDARILSVHVPIEGQGIYLVAATYVPQMDRYLFMWTANDADYHFGWSDTNDLFTLTDIIPEMYTWNTSELVGGGWAKWQTLNFVKSCSNPTQGCTEVDGLYLIGTNNTRRWFEEPTGDGEDWSRLFEVTLKYDYEEGGPVTIEYVDEHHHKLDDPSMGDWDAAGGTYVSPSGQLILYSSKHDNGGLDNTIQLGEFRNVNLRWEARVPNWKMPGSDLCGGWVELYSDPQGWSHHLDSSVDRSLMFDYKDRGKDDWNDLKKYNMFFGDTASAVKFTLAEGQVAWLFEDAFTPTPDGSLPEPDSSDWPGKFIKLIGDGKLHTIDDVSDVNFYKFDDKGNEVETDDGADDEISSVWIEEPPGFNLTEICDGQDNNCNGISDEGFEPDDDKDGWGFECDNCPVTSNAGQEDADEDGEGDACDPIADANGPYSSECSAFGGANVELDGSGSFDPDGELVTFYWLVGNEGASGVQPVVFVPLNTHNVVLTVTDNHGNSDSDETTVTVEDTTPPDITSMSTTPDLLWPPNGKMVSVEVSVSATDTCDAAPMCSIISIESNEPEGKKPDSEITGDLTANLRARRLGGGTGRVYTITVSCVDGSGNSSTSETTAVVPHDQDL